MKTLENDLIKVTIKEEGAELSSLYNKKTDTELLWQGNPEFWNRQSPVLFPNVGKQYGMHYLYEGIYYNTNQHGFARDMAFTLIDNSDNAATLQLLSNDQTKEVFPFDFSFDINYTLEESKLTVTWIVKNTGEKPMYFTIGAHPAFNTVPQKSDYALYFPDKDSITYRLLNTDTGCALPETYTLDLVENRLALSNSLFEKDALIFDDYQISECILETSEGKQILKMITPDFPNYGIWSKPEAPFICLEPWDGRADNEGFSDEISKKPGIITVNPGDEYRKSYTIEVL